MLLESAETFATDITDLHQPADVEPMKIDTGDNKPVHIKPYRLSSDQVTFLRETIEHQKEAGVVRTS
jgi:non-homologous end joining protein Ku